MATKAERLAQMLAAIPPHITELNLRKNGLGNKNSDELAKALALTEALSKIPDGVTNLNLGESDLTSLNLKNNDLNDKSG